MGLVKVLQHLDARQHGFLGMRIAEAWGEGEDEMERDEKLGKKRQDDDEQEEDEEVKE